MNNYQASFGRIAAIDVFRALTMLCMIFVNHLWSISNVPHWLEHAATNEDFLGFSDIVFPAFLFILGASLPFAIENRYKKGDNTLFVIAHILLRTVALLVMGVFTVNAEAGTGETSMISKSLFSVLMVTGFILIWNLYPKKSDKQWLFRILQFSGIIVLVVIAFLYRGPKGNCMGTSWWGILGLIGWTYLICALLYLIVRQNIIANLIVYIAFVGISIASATTGIGIFKHVIVGGGSLHLFTMAGVLVSLFLSQYGKKFSFPKVALTFSAAALVCFIAGYISHQFWIISKIQGTLTWVFYCTGLILLFYLFIHWLVQVQGKEHWFMLIKTAGTATLTCYLISYVTYAVLFGWMSYTLPEAINSGAGGIIKCIVFAFAVIGVAYLLGKIKIKLKI